MILFLISRKSSDCYVVVIGKASTGSKGENMERVKDEKEQDKVDIEQVLKEQGYLMTLPLGTSMLPFIRPQKDIIVVRRYEGKAECRDVVLYRRKGGKLVLHRILEVNTDSYVLCGDNQYKKEYGIRKEQVLGVLEGVYRGEKYIDCRKDKIYKGYIKIWCSSLFIRRIILKVGWTFIRGFLCLKRKFAVKKK